MKSLTKRIGAFLGCFIAAMSIVYLGMNIKVNAADDSSMGYFYNQLSEDTRAQNFYKAFAELEKNGEFKKGKVEYDLVSKNVISTHDAEVFVNNVDDRVQKAYGAGRDTFFMDHPDLFYIDVFGTSINAGQQGQNYVAFLDTSRSLSLYLGELDTEAKVKEAVEVYEKKLTEIVTEAKKAGGIKEQIEFVNKYIADHTEYSFGTVVKNGKNVDTPAAAYINTAYGSIVNGQAICGGYAKGFKAVMDRLNIPCVCVQGYSLSSGSSSFQAHMWNYVEIEGQWYAVDPTWNDTSGSLNKWLLVGGETLFVTHMEDNVVSSSGYELKYPAIKPYNYGTDTDDNGMAIEGEYKDSTDGTGKQLILTVSFENKGAMKLQEEGKYLSFRYGDKDKTSGEIKWSVWFNAIATDTMFMGMFKFEEDYMQIFLHAGFEYVQFALIDYAPDENNGAFFPNEPQYGENAGKPWFYTYKQNVLTEEHFLGEISAPYHNNGYGSYVPSPGAAGVYPSNGGSLPVDKTYEITVTYNDSLKLMEDKTEDDIEMDFYTSRGNDTVKENAVISNVKWDGDKKITFTFTPSRMYIHNQAIYYFTPTNLVGVKSNKVPDAFTYSFKGKSVVCSKVFNDGRLYMNVFGAPQMLDDSDLSVTDFKDENGNYYAESQRSQLLLVASKPSKAQEDRMDEVLKRDTPIKDADIVTSATYEISLQICGVVRKVPNGSYMQVAFGFPEGYSPDDAGTTFKIYHYKHDDKGNITGVEEIPAIITKYGLIAQVKSFSPFTIVQVKNTSEAVQKDKKSIYANVIGNGGSISVSDSNGKGGITEVTEKSITYTLTSEKGYQIACVRLNGKALDLSRIVEGKLTLTNAELESSNLLEVTFVTSESVQNYIDRGITISNVEMTNVPQIPEPASNSNTIVIVICSIVAVLVVAGAVVATVILLKRKQAKA